MKRVGILLLLVLVWASPSWAANKTVYVDGTTSSGHYTTLAAAITGEVTANADLTSMAGILNIEISTTGADGCTTINGFTTSAAYYLNIYTTASARHAGVWSASKYRIVCASMGSGALRIQDGNVHLTGLQVSQSSYSSALWVDTGSDVIDADLCIFQNTGESGNSVVYYGAGTAFSLRRSVVYTADASSGHGVIATVGTLTIENVTIGNAGANGLNANGGSTVVNATNVYAGGSATADFGTGGGGTLNMTTCASSDTSAGGTAGDSIAYSTTNFNGVTAGSEDLTLKNAALAAVSATDKSATYTTDIAGTTFSAWRIGAFATASAPPASTFPVLLIIMEALR